MLGWGAHCHPGSLGSQHRCRLSGAEQEPQTLCHPPEACGGHWPQVSHSRGSDLPWGFYQITNPPALSVPRRRSHQGSSGPSGRWEPGHLPQPLRILRDLGHSFPPPHLFLSLSPLLVKKHGCEIQQAPHPSRPSGTRLSPCPPLTLTLSSQVSVVHAFSRHTERSTCLASPWGSYCHCVPRVPWNRFLNRPTLPISYL